MPHERGRVPPQPALPPGEAFPTGGLASCPEPGSGRYRQDSLLPVSGFPPRRRARWRRQPHPTPRQRGVPHHRATSCLAAQEAPPASGREPVGPRPPARARRALVRPTSRPPPPGGAPPGTCRPSRAPRPVVSSPFVAAPSPGGTQSPSRAPPRPARSHHPSRHPRLVAFPVSVAPRHLAHFPRPAHPLARRAPAVR